MQDSIIARKYALALFNAAKNSGELDRVSEDLESIDAFNTGDDRLSRYLESPQVSTAAKMELLDKAFKDRTTDLTTRFLHLILEKKRIDQLHGMIETFRDLVRAHRGIVRAEVRTAVALLPDQKDRLKANLAKMTGKTVEIESEVDPAILGGVVVEFENQIIDRSVRRGLDDLRDTLMKVRVL